MRCTPLHDKTLMRFDVSCLFLITSFASEKIDMAQNFFRLLSELEASKDSPPLMPHVQRTFDELSGSYKTMQPKQISQSSFDSLLNCFQNLYPFCKLDPTFLPWGTELLIYAANFYSISTDPANWIELFRLYCLDQPSYDRGIKQILITFQDTLTFFPFWWIIFSDTALNKTFPEVFITINAILSSDKFSVKALQYSHQQNIIPYCRMISNISSEDQQVHLVHAIFDATFPITLEQIPDSPPSSLSSYKASIPFGIRKEVVQILKKILSNSPDDLTLLIKTLMIPIVFYSSKLACEKVYVDEDMAYSILRVHRYFLLFEEEKLSTQFFSSRTLMQKTFASVPGIDKSPFLWFWYLALDFELRRPPSILLCPEDVVLSYAGQLAVAFSPALLEFEVDSIKNTAASISKKKQDAQISQFLSKLCLIDSDPVAFDALFFCGGSPRCCFGIDAHDVPKETALSILHSFINGFNGKPSSIVGVIVERLTKIQNVVKGLCQIDNNIICTEFIGFLTNPSKDEFVTNLKAALSILAVSDTNALKSPNLEDFLKLVRNSLLSSDSSVREIGFTAASFCVGRLTKYSYGLLSLVVDEAERCVNREKSLSMLLSTYNICQSSESLEIHPALREPLTKRDFSAAQITEDIFNNNEENWNQKLARRSINIIKQINKGPLDYLAANCVVSLVLFDLSRINGITDEVMELTKDTFSKTDFSDDFDFRIFNVFTSMLEDLNSPALIDSLLNFCSNIAKRKDCGLNLFKQSVEAIVDILSMSSKNNIEKLYELIPIDKSDELKAKILFEAEQQYLYFSESDIETNPMPGQASYFAIADNRALHKVIVDGPGVDLLTKTPFSLVQHRVSVSAPRECKNIWKETESILPSTETDTSEFEQAFNSAVDELINGSPFEPSMFEGNPQPKLTYPSFATTTQNSDLFDLKDENSGDCFITPPASALFGAIYPSYEFKGPFNMLEIGAGRALDMAPRNTVKLGLLYVKGNATQNEILGTTWAQTSSDFKSFVLSLGELVDLLTHTGFAGKLDQGNLTNGRYHVCFGCRRYEVFFHTAALMPNDATNQQQIYKKRHIGNDNVHIVWVDDASDYDVNTITSQFNDAHVVIFAADQFYRVVVRKKDPNRPIGPLFNEIVVPPAALPTLARWTATIADRVVRQMADPPYEQIAEAISELSSMQKV